MFQQKLFSLMNARWGLWPRISWNLPDFKIMSFCVMIKYRSFIFQKTNQKSFCWNIWFYKVWGGFHLKSGGFHVKSKDLLQGIATLCLYYFSVHLQESTVLRGMDMIVVPRTPIPILTPGLVRNPSLIPRRIQSLTNNACHITVTGEPNVKLMTWYTLARW